MTQPIADPDDLPKKLLMFAAGGVLSGLLTPLAPHLIERIGDGPADFRVALVAVPFAVLVFFVVRRCSPNPLWAALAASIITVFAFICAVNAAIWIDAQAYGAGKIMRNMLAGLTGGLVGAGLMAFGIALLPAGPRSAGPWLRMVLTGTLLGTLLAVDSALGLDLTSVLYPLWQAGVAVRLGAVLQQGGMR